MIHPQKKRYRPILKMVKPLFFWGFIVFIIGCKQNQPEQKKVDAFIKISISEYHNKLEGFWLGQCIANWTGLVTEMDKIGSIGELKTGKFYTRNDWEKPDQPSIWGEGIPSELSSTIDFVLRDSSEVWGADDDTDIEYMYQHLLITNKTSILSPEMIRDGWIKHIKSEEENYLWVSNQKAYDLMQDGFLPPETGSPENNEHFEMIDAQLTTEIFGLFSPTRPDVALKMADLPIKTVARKNAFWISQFYVVMHALASKMDTKQSIDKQSKWLASEARKILPDQCYAAKMYDFVKQKYDSNIPWEQARDAIYNRYQVEQKDGYDITSKNLYCNGCFAAGINYAAGMVSWFYGEGDFKETIKIGTLMGWDSDNPTATWGGLLGFMYGKKKTQSLFPVQLSTKFNIHRTRQNFENNGIDTFENMAQKGIQIINRVVLEEINGSIEDNYWIIPQKTH